MPAQHLIDRSMTEPAETLTEQIFELEEHVTASKVVKYHQPLLAHRLYLKSFPDEVVLLWIVKEVHDCHFASFSLFLL